MSSLISKLGHKCTDSICHKTCPVWWFKNEGAGKNTGNSCVECLRFTTVEEAVKLWLSNKAWDKDRLNSFGDEYD